MTIRTYFPILLLVISNIFMAWAWYGHLRTHKDSPLWVAILISWGIAFFEYCLMVPANRMGYGHFSLPQLKILQEVITLLVFGGFVVFVMKERLHLNHLYAGLCLVGAVYFTFKK